MPLTIRKFGLPTFVDISKACCSIVWILNADHSRIKIIIFAVVNVEAFFFVTYGGIK